MKISISKSAKRVLSLVIAFAMLLGSLFVANVGVTISANAETEGIVVKWDGSIAPSFTDTASTGGKDDPIEIVSPAELAYLAKSVGMDSESLYYKIADGISAFDFSGYTWSATYNATPFAGFFDGNNVVMRNISGSQNASSALFACVDTNTGDQTVSFKNIIVEDSSFSQTAGNYSHGAAAIVGWNSSANGSTPGSIIIENCKVVNSTFTSAASTGSTVATAGILCADVQSANITISNCYISGNTVTAYGGATSYGGLVGLATATVSISNTICLGTGNEPWAKGTSPSAKLTAADTYTNVYTDQSVDTGVYSENNIKELTVGEMTGEKALTNMSLDFGTVWFANLSGVPVLRSLHNVTALNNNDGTHAESCGDCGLEGLTVEHIYNIVDYDTNISQCACGHWVYGTNDVWDGTKADAFAGGSGTEDDPYIIKTVEQLFKMVRDEGVMRDADGNRLDKDGNIIDDDFDFDSEVAAYYKVADTVNALYINDTRGYDGQKAFEAAAAGGTLKNWSGDLVRDSRCDECNTSGIDVTKHMVGAYNYSFAGNFDGNGVTIYGLYSKVTNNGGSYTYEPGTGFFPGLAGNATVKNVIFDNSYISSAGKFVSVVTNSFGYSNAGADPNSTTYEGYCHPHRFYADADVTIMNIAVRNAYVSGVGAQKSETYGVNGYATGIVAAAAMPDVGLSISNCLFDGTGSTLTTTGTNQNYAGIIATDNYANTLVVTNCVSIGADVAIADNERDDGSDIFVYNNYVYDVNEPYYANAEVQTKYTSTCATHGNTHVQKYIEPITINDAVHTATDYTTVGGMASLNWTQWDISEETVTKYGTPMPAFDTDAEALANDHYKQQYKNIASSPVSGYEQGVFSYYNTLIGGGTEEDPYIISDAETLFAIIASGGTNRGVPQYFKLGCNIDLGGAQWADANNWVHEYVNEETDEAGEINYYIYKNFAGTIDGDGHTITGMFTSDVDKPAGFVPVLASTGVIKNIHFRNCYAYSKNGSEGIIAGSTESGATIENCSIEGSVGANYIGDKNVTPSNSYIIYADGTGGYTLNADLGTSGWYGIVGETARLVSFAKAQPCADIDADGLGEEYGSSDISALKQNLLRKSAYKYIYGDASGNGTTDMRDLAALIREVNGDTNWVALDGFWKNVKAGNIDIYYNDADNYDFARKLELYLEEMVPGTDIEKIDITKTDLASLPNTFAINLITSGDDVNAWSYVYDLEDARLDITGGSFTAVEEAVDNFIAKADIFTNPENNSGSLNDVVDSQDNAYKTSVTVNGKPYYYAWGDEFDSGDKVNIDGTEYTTVSYDKWLLRNKGTDTTLDDEDSSNDHQTEFAYISSATDKQAPGINQVDEEEGTLTLKRGINGPNDYYASGLSSRNSMLFKQGYMEMKATLPADGFAFPSWWLYTHNSGHTSNKMIAQSLYSKVYKENTTTYNGAASFDGSDYRTYQYQLPTQTLEIDIFEIIQKPNVTGGFNNNFTVNKSSDKNLYFNVHKWYTYSRSITKNDGTYNLNVYDLNWNNLPTDGYSFTSLLSSSSTSENSGYSTPTESKIIFHEGNLGGGSVNVSIKQSGNSKYTDSTMRTSFEDLFNSDSTQVTERRYGFLWNETEMKFYVYDLEGNSTANTDTDDDGTNDAFVVTVSKDDLNFDNGQYTSTDNFGFEQYAYFLIENHMYTANETTSDIFSGWGYADLDPCNMVIDYVRLYQLDDHRDIITPESESIYDR